MLLFAVHFGEFVNFFLVVSYFQDVVFPPLDVLMCMPPWRSEQNIFFDVVSIFLFERCFWIRKNVIVLIPRK